MPTPADRIARRSSLGDRADLARLKAVRALTHLRAPETTQAPADRTARRA